MEQTDNDKLKKPSKNRSLDYTTSYKAGQDNVHFLGFDIHNPVFSTSALLMIIFITFTLLMPSKANEILMASRTWVINNFDWFFMIAVNAIVLFCIAIAASPLGKIRLGGGSSKAEFSTFSWYCMLFASGVGIGLLFWGVAEPVAYYTDWYGTPLNVEARTPEAKNLALSSALFHWGIHGWATFGIVGLALAFFSYNKGMPFTIRSAFYPILGEKCWGTMGNIIDILAAIATIFGLATSLGLGAQQVASGLNYLFNIPDTTTTQVIVIILITLITFFSIIRGMDKGVRFLSNLNIILAIILLAIILVIGNTLGLLHSIGNTFISYAKEILPLSNWIGRDDSTWFHGWTIFYWAWWISWSPFVGMFMARISKGRTIREFFLAVFIVPSIFIGIWFGIIGGTGIDLVESNSGELANGISSVSLALFQMYGELPMTGFLSAFSIVLLVIFFVTSADSGAIVIDSIASGGKVDTLVRQRVFWASMIALIAIALLVGGGSQALLALQAGVVATGLPFVVILIVLCYSLFKGLMSEVK